MLDLDTRRQTRSSTALALAVWAVLVAVAVVWGHSLVERGYRLDLSAPPFWSPQRFHLNGRALPAVLVAGLVAWHGPRVAGSLRWRTLVFMSAGTATVWAVVVAYVDNLDGVRALTDPVRPARNDYIETARRIGSLPSFLSHFVDRISSYNQHTMGHPPGMVVVEWALTKIGLATGWFNGMLVVAGGVTAAVAALVALREVAGERAARTAAPFLTLVPAVIWWQTADALFAGVTAIAITLVVLASGREGAASDRYAFAGGVVFGVTAFLSYGLVLLALVPLTVCVARRRFRPLLLATAGVVPVFVLFAAAGFSWFAGLAATRHAYTAGVARHRPYDYFLVANLAVFGVAIGPAVAVAIARLRDRRVWLLVGAILAVVAIADVSGMSKAEVERIWLPFVPWVALSTAAFTGRDARPWLALQGVATLVVAVTMWSQW